MSMSLALKKSIGGLTRESQFAHQWMLVSLKVRKVVIGGFPGIAAKTHQQSMRTSFDLKKKNGGLAWESHYSHQWIQVRSKVYKAAIGGFPLI